MHIHRIYIHFIRKKKNIGNIKNISINKQNPARCDANRIPPTAGAYLFLERVLCFSACSTSNSSTCKPLRRRTESMQSLARFAESALSPKCKYSSSVDGIQYGSMSTICNEKKNRQKQTTIILLLWKNVNRWVCAEPTFQLNKYIQYKI